MSEGELENLEVTPREVKERLEKGEKFLFLDVREPWEHGTAKIEGATLIPMREIPANCERIAEAGDVVVFCHHGIRSLDVTVWLRGQGVEMARSMKGGIERWAVEIDPTVARY